MPFNTEISRDGSARVRVAEMPTEYNLAVIFFSGFQYFRSILMGMGLILLHR